MSPRAAADGDIRPPIFDSCDLWTRFDNVVTLFLSDDEA